MFSDNKMDWPTQMETYIKFIELTTRVMRQAELMHTRILELQNLDIYEKLKPVYNNYFLALFRLGLNAESYAKEAAELLDLHTLKK